MATMSEHFKQLSRAETFKRDQHNTLSQLADLLSATGAQRQVRRDAWGYRAASWPVLTPPAWCRGPTTLAAPLAGV